MLKTIHNFLQPYAAFEAENIMKFVISLKLLLIFFFCASAAKDIKITELLASNASSGYDERGGTSDWIELRNVSTKPISLKNYRISDKSNFSMAFTLPDTVLQPGGCMLVWASKYPDTVPHPTIIRGASGGIGHWRNSDSFHFLSLPVSGNFTVAIRLHNLNGNEGAEAGLILREENAPISRYYGIMLQTNEDIKQHLNPSVQPSPENGYFSLNPFPASAKFPYVWLRIQRDGDSIVASVSRDKYFWQYGERYFFSLKNNRGFVGFAFSSSNGNISERAGFSDFELNGKIIKANELNYTALQCNPATIYQSNEIHAPFSLSQSGEKIFLWNETGNLEDTLRFGAQRRNISYGIDGNGRKAFFAKPTPGKANPSAGAEGFLPDPIPSANSGYYIQPFSLNFSPSPDTSIKICYTTDLTEPNENSNKVKSVLQITKTSTFRFRAFKNGFVPSRIVTRTFIFGETPPQGISTVFLTAKPEDLLGDSAGIWANMFSNREIPIHIELSDGSNEIFSVEMGAKNHGNAAQQLAQKPLDIQLSSPYGDGEITNIVFPEKQASAIKKLLLRNSSQDWKLSLLRDALGSRLGLKLGLDAQGYRPARTYLNGEYWGLYQLREKSEASFLASNHGIDEKAVELMGALGSPIQGNSKEWNASIMAAADTAMTSDSVFAIVSAPFDLPNYIRYWGLEIFAMNPDWPGGNIKSWRCGKQFPKWKFIVYDNDLSFLANTDVPPDFNMFDYLLSPMQTSWSNQPIATALFRGFMQNQSFKNRFLSRIADFLNIVWSPQNTIPLLDTLANEIAPEIPLHSQRWPESAAHWNDEVEKIRLFLLNRPDNLRKNILSTFGISGLTAVSVRTTDIDGGALRLNSIDISSGEFEGIYFKDIPLHFVANPTLNYEFIGWKYADADTLFSTAPSIKIVSETDSLSVVAVYQAAAASAGNIVINEIMYKAPDAADTKDWIELYNNDSKPRDISGWTLKDDDDSHAFTFPQGTFIAADNYLVVVQDSLVMRQTYPYPFSIVGQFDFGFGRTDAVRLYDALGKIMDSVGYDRTAPWPADADGNGASLELVDPQTDNALPINWRASLVHLGTPGRKNSVYAPQAVAVDSKKNDLLIELTPNPADDRDVILHASAVVGKTMDAALYNNVGLLVWQNTALTNSGELSMEIPVKDIPAGCYYVVVRSLDDMQEYRCALLTILR